jgi:flagellar assembly protein FliH
MMTTSHIVSFDRPLRAVQLTHLAERRHTAADLADAYQRGFRAGGDEARELSNSQLVELRAHVQEMSEGLLARLSEAHELLLGRIREALPQLTLEVGARLLAGLVPPPELVERLCREALDQLYPEREGLELVVGPRDAAVLERLMPTWRTHFPGLRVTVDDTLDPGDCLVRSRFGVTDARASAKLTALRTELAIT